ncbi:MAG TPA: hypothetical protein VMV70_04135 [Gallionella sp.]|nr:hypothetical protein [Gallionella sp.]
MQTKNNLVLCVATLWLLGCATPVDMRARTPSLDLTSSLSAKTVAICIADRWENAKIIGMSAGFPINMRQTPDGYTVSASVHNAFETWTGLLADINDNPSGSTTRYFVNGVLGEGSFENAVKECQ